jgi:hypothetical protein
MSDLEDFEDWSHPPRPLALPRRRACLHWGRLIAFAVALLMLWGTWQVYRIIHEAFRTVYGS